MDGVCMSQVVATWVFESSQKAYEVFQKVSSDVYPEYSISYRENKVLIDNNCRDVSKASRICEALGGRLE
jgi:hypothetical protein